MEKLIGILIFSIGSAVSYEGSITPVNPGSVQEKVAITVNESDTEARHFITDHDCHIIEEWLDRRSIGHFIKKHFTTVRLFERIIEKTHFNDTFTP